MLKLKFQYIGHLKELTHLKRPWFWERLKAGGEGDDRGWDGWMASRTRWPWVWASSRSWWWTGRPCVLQPMGSQRVRHDWPTEMNWNEENINYRSYYKQDICFITWVQNKKSNFSYCSWKIPAYWYFITWKSSENPTSILFSHCVGFNLHSLDKNKLLYEEYQLKTQGKKEQTDVHQLVRKPHLRDSFLFNNALNN